MFKTVFQIIDELSTKWPDKSPCIVFRNKLHSLVSGQDRELSSRDCFPASNLPNKFIVTELEIDEEGVENINGSIHTSRFLFVIPPIMSSRELPKSLSHLYPNETLEEIICKKFIDQLQDGDHILLLLPETTIQNERTQEFRKYLFSISKPLVIVTFRNDELFPWIAAQFSFSLLLLEIKPSQRKPIKFFSIPRTPDGELDIINDFRRLLKSKGGQTAYGYVLWENLPAEIPLHYERFHPDLDKYRQELATVGAVKPLGEIFDCFCGINVITVANEILSEKQSDSFTLISGRNLQNGIISSDDAKFINQPPSKYIAQPKDILVRALIGYSRNLSPTIIYEHSPRYAIQNSINVLRPKVDLTFDDIDFVGAYLKSEIARRHLAAMSTNTKSSCKELSVLPVPLMDKSLRVSINALNEAQKQFANWSHEAEALKQALFTFSEIKKARSQIIPTGRISRLRLNMALSADEISFRIKAQFPHPIAFRWRTVEASRQDLLGYVEILECAETLLAYMGIIALVLARTFHFPMKSLAQVAQRISLSQRGINMGDWVNILNEFRDIKYEMSDAYPFLMNEFITTLFEEQKKGLIAPLSARRLDQAHGRGPKGDAIAKEFVYAKRELEDLLAQFEMLSEYPLRFIENTRIDSIKRVLYLKVKDLMGDHPLSPVKEDSSQDLYIEQGSLYICDRNNSYHLLRPFMHRYVCPECGSIATFHLENIDIKDEKVILKGLEHGHNLSVQNSFESFREVGLIL
jgi:hypothetical protein